MDNFIEKLRALSRSLDYLDERKEQNQQILNNRLREISGNKRGQRQNRPSQYSPNS